jgi:hypothetical protein
MTATAAAKGSANRGLEEKLAGEAQTTVRPSPHRVIDYLRRMSFLTDFTPRTLRARSAALFAAACELTKPLS